MMTSWASINKGAGSIRHRFVKIFEQKGLFHGKIASLPIHQLHGAVLPDHQFSVAQGIGLVLQFPLLFQQPSELCQIRPYPGPVQNVQCIPGAKVYLVEIEMFHGAQKDRCQFLFHPVPVVAYQFFECGGPYLFGGEPHPRPVSGGDLTVLEKI